MIRGDSRGLFGRRRTAIGLLALLGACAMNQRAESVYLKQHRAAAALTEAIIVIETENPFFADPLYDTEAELAEACAPLREAGYRKLIGDEIDSDLEWAIVGSLDGCAAKTREVETLLWRIDPDTARYFLGGLDIASPTEQN